MLPVARFCVAANVDSVPHKVSRSANEVALFINCLNELTRISAFDLSRATLVGKRARHYIILNVMLNRFREPRLKLMSAFSFTVA